ncbi:HD domain-containing protein [Streptomyces sp. WG-D5]
MGGTKRALLIAAAGADLDFVVDDVERIKDALLGSGWNESDVTVLDTPENTTQRAINKALVDLFGQCEDDDFALVYFSGHGVRIKDVDHLVPGDAKPDDLTWALIAVEPDTLLESLRTRATVVMFLDACRDARETEPPALRRQWQGSWDNVALVRPCAAGQQAWGTQEEGSFMGRALAEALARRSSPRTVGEVIAYVRKRTAELARAAEGCPEQQEVREAWLSGTSEPPDKTHTDWPVCLGGIGEDRWEQAVSASKLWDRIPERTAVDTTGLKSGLNGLIGEVRKIKRNADGEDRAGADPWEDVRFPERVLERLNDLIPPSPQGELSPLEVVALLATPFVREAAVACGRRALAELRREEQRSEGRLPGDKGHMWQDMTDVRAAYQQIDDKRRHLEEMGQRDEAEAAEQWLWHRLIADWDQLWRPAQAQGWQGQDGERRYPVCGLDSLSRIIERLWDIAALATGTGPQQRPRHQKRLRAALLQVTALMRARPGPKAPDDKDWDAGLGEFLGIGGAKAWRPRPLAALLHVAELLAIDSRLLDGIVVDHLGVDHDRVRPEDVVAQVEPTQAEFQPVEDHGRTTRDRGPRAADWTLDAECANPALYLALERQADAVLTAARTLTRTVQDPDLLPRLPRHMNTDRLDPTDGSYDAPPPRFQLAEDGVKPLIMGTQLYGDHRLALRELYQNAVDACRRRHARQRYAAALGLNGLQPSDVRELGDYTVKFVLAREEKTDRIYVECEDDGIGMTDEELRDLFARAGRRHQQSPIRVREMRRWRRAGIEPELNSRFGIGVFSYFMLADKIQVSTRPADETGVGQHSGGHQVNVVTDSGIMHMNRFGGPVSGTRVRLYLRPEYSQDPPSIVQFLQQHVWVSPVRVTVTEELHGTPADELPPDTLRPHPTARRSRTEAPNVWWVPGEGALLVDGIFVSGAERPHGYVVNLQHRHRPELTADRNRLEKYEREVLYDDLAKAARALVEWDPLPLTWLWELVRDDAKTAEIVLGRLLTADTRVHVTTWHGDSDMPGDTTVPLTSIGCLPFDESYHSSMPRNTRHGAFFLYWRRQLVETDNHESRDPAATLRWPEGFPQHQAVDAALFHALTDERVHDPVEALLVTAAQSEHSLRGLLRALRRFAVAGLHLPDTEDIRRLDTLDAGQSMSLASKLYAEYLKHGLDRPLDTDPDDPPVHSALLYTAGSELTPLGRVTEVAQQLRLMDPRVPEPPDPGDLATRFPTQQELAVLQGDPSQGASDIPATVTPLVASYFADASRTRTQIVETAGRYERYGYRVSGEFDAPPVSGADLQSLGLDSGFVIVQGRFDIIGLISLSAARGHPSIGHTVDEFRAALDRLDGYARLPQSLLSIKAPDWWRRLRRVDVASGERLGVLSLLRALVGADAPPSIEDEVRAITALAEAGVVSERASNAVKTWWATSRDHRPIYLLHDGRQGLLGGPYLSRPWIPVATSDDVEGAFLVYMAANNNFTLGRTARILIDEARPYGIEVPHVPLSAEKLSPGSAEITALFYERAVKWRDTISPSDIAQYARRLGLDLATAAAELKKYEPLGCPTIPSPGTPVEQREPTDHPKHRLADDLLGHEPLRGGTVTPLGLVVTAVRLDLGLLDTYRVLARYKDYGLALDCPEPAPDPHSPDWRDVVILSRRLTGREPALSGEVTDDDVELRSEETDLGVPEVRRRLALHAPLFGFHLASATEESTGSTHVGA